jgi:hypothetical protein
MPITTREEVKLLLQLPVAIAAVYRFIPSSTPLANGDTLTIGSVTYTFKTTPAVKNDILVQATIAAQADVIVKAINGVADGVNIPFLADEIIGFTGSVVDTTNVLLTADVAGVAAGTITITCSNSTALKIITITSPKDSVATQDSLIDSLIVIVQDFIVRRINNFAMPHFYVETYSPTFTASDKSINNDTNDFTESQLIAGNEILVSGSYQNNKIFTIGSVAAHKITVSEAVVDETNDIRVVIQKILFTNDIKLAVADFIAMKLNKDKTVKSRSLGDHSESFFTQDEMLETFSSFRKLNWD